MNVALHPAPAPSTRNILSLCAGVGGLELGILLALDALGEAGRGICYVEREAAAASSLVASMEAGWFHHAPVWSDMLTFDARPWRGVVHILASGDPCQDNSVAGKRAGADGDRFLASQVCRLAEECRPDLIFRENVPGNADGQLGAIVPALERLGYRVAAGVFSSAETGNTMRRERLFIMAEREGGGCGEQRPPSGPGHIGHPDSGGAGCGQPVAVTDGGISRNGGLQRGGELGFQLQGDGTGGGSDRTIDVASAGDLGRQQNPGSPHGDETANEGRAAQHDHQPASAGIGLGRAPSPRSLPGAYPGICGSEESRRPRDAEPERRGGDMDGPASAERRPINSPCGTGRGDDVSQRQEGPDGVGEPSEGLGSTQNLGHERRGPSRRRRDRSADAGFGMEPGELAGSGDPRSQGQQRGQHDPSGRQDKGRYAGFRSGAILHPPAVIPGPTDRRWADLLDRFPEYQPALSAQEAESHLRRGIDPLAHRIERLRATGNGVDPVVAAYAFLSLRALLAGERGAGAGVTVLTEAA